MLITSAERVGDDILRVTVQVDVPLFALIEKKAGKNTKLPKDLMLKAIRKVVADATKEKP